MRKKVLIIAELTTESQDSLGWKGLLKTILFHPLEEWEWMKMLQKLSSLNLPSIRLWGVNNVSKFEGK